jgi:type VII secretion integral membrane protein EccD
MTWPEPAFDDVIEEIAASAKKHGRSWDASATRTLSLVAAGLVLLTGLGVLVGVGPHRLVPAMAAAGVAGILLAGGALLSRALGDGVAGAAAGGMSLPCAAAAGMLIAGGTEPALQLGSDQVLVGAAALLFASVVGATAVGHGLRIFVGGVTAGMFGLVGASLGYAVSTAGAAAILVVLLVGGIGLAPLLAVRLGKLPVPVVTASADAIATEPRPERQAVQAAVIRADEILVGSLLGISIVAAACVVVLTGTAGISGPLLGGLASGALLLRARLFPSIAARLPMLTSGLVGLALTAAAVAASSGSATRLTGVALACFAVVALLGTAATAHRRHVSGSPYLGRLADILDITTVVALAPVACGVLNVYQWIRGLAG